MKEIDKRKTPIKNQSKRTARAERKERRPHQENISKTLDAKETTHKALDMKPNNLVSESIADTKPLEVHQNSAIDHVADSNKFEETNQDSKANVIADRENVNGVVEDKCTVLEKDVNHRKEEVSDSETMADSVSSKSDSITTKEEKVERASNFPEDVLEDNSSDCSLHNSSEQFDRGIHQSQSKELSFTPEKTTNFDRDPPRVKNKKSSKGNARGAKIVPKPSSESSEGTDYQIVDGVKDIEVLDEALNGVPSIRNGPDTNGDHDDQAACEQKIEEMEKRIDKLEEELRIVAALEMSLYSVVPEHGSSAHKVHTPARRLSRIYIYACKHWSQDKRAIVAKNIVSGLVLIAKSCGSDVPRLTFWLSNTIVTREITSQTFSSIRSSNPMKSFVDSNNGSQRNGGKPTAVQWKNSSGSKQVNKYMQCTVEDWQETGTFMVALEKVESWIFSRIVESVWWQSLTPNMQPRDASKNKSRERLMGPSLGDQQQGNFSINLWRSTFQDAFQRLCPVRASGHECGCLPVLARMVMEQCVSRLDVAMFNAILRESAHEIPTDPVSDPIVDAKVLPIPAGDLSFGSGAQLKNSVGNWSRWLTDMVGIDSDDSLVDQHGSDENIRPDGDGRPQSFPLLNSLSDLLMLPKDMLTDRSIREEVCPSISLPLITRILCNFTPDEFCPDPIPGTVLELLNAENIVERRLSGYSGRNFPYIAAPAVYISPSTSDVAEKVAEAGGKSHLERNISAIQRKGYTSDEELEELDSPLSSIVDKSISSPSYNARGNGRHEEDTTFITTNMRYKLLQEVWSV